MTDVISIADLDALPVQGTLWRANGTTLVIAAGGDGLVGGVITHIVGSNLPLGILPLGTANDIARSLGLPLDLQQAVMVIAQGRTTTIDIGIAHPAEQATHLANSKQQKPSEAHISPQKHAYFAHVLAVGLNVQFARLATNIAVRERYGKLTYPLATLQVLKEHQPLEMTLCIEGLALPSRTQAPPVISAEPVSLHCRALQTTVINAPIFGGQWNLAVPAASLHDHLLDIVIIEDVGLQDLLPALTQLLQQATARPSQSPWHARNPQLQAAELTGIAGIHHIQARKITITTNIDPQDVTLDGEVRGQTPLETAIAEEPLQVLIP